MTWNKIKTIGDLRKIIDGMDDDFMIEMRVMSKVSDEELAKRQYKYPYDTEYFNGIEMDDICTSDRVLCLGVEIGNTSKDGDIINNIVTNTLDTIFFNSSSPFYNFSPVSMFIISLNIAR